MPELRVIYTPEASYFRRGDIEMLFPKNPKDKDALKLRESYRALKKNCPSAQKTRNYFLLSNISSAIVLIPSLVSNKYLGFNKSNTFKFLASSTPAFAIFLADKNKFLS